MAGELTLRVITPERIALDEAVHSVQIPGLDGSLGILRNHAPMVAALAPGELTWRSARDQPKHSLFVSGGFAEVRDNTVRIVAEAGERPGEIDVDRARAAEQRARERMAAMRPLEGEPIDFLRAETALRRALWRLRVGETAQRSP